MTLLARFNRALSLAQDYLRFRHRRGVLLNAAGWTELALAQARRALGLANAMQNRERRALCMRILNWLRADLAVSCPARTAA